MSRFCVLPKSKLGDWVDWLIASYRVFGPRRSETPTRFGVLGRASELQLDYAQTDIPPKKCIIPQRQPLYRFDMTGLRMEPLIEPIPTVLFGVHTCDQHAIRLFDRIFTQGFVDQHYARQREVTFVVGIECLRPCSENSFCRSMGTLSPAIGTFDLHLVDLGADYSIEIGSERGAQLVHGYRGVFVASHSDLEKRNQALSAKWQHFKYRLNCDASELPNLLSESYGSSHWDELGTRCLACGMCTQVCPTCYCFDIEDEVNLELSQGYRIRRWDSCQINDFARVAGGHDFREKRAKRQRHRFMRKGKYQQDANDMVGCVGCGRCATACLVDISPISTFNALWQERCHGSPAVEAVT